MRRGWGSLLAAGALIVAGAVGLGISQRGAPQDGPDGLSALVRFLRIRDRPVTRAATPPPDGTFFLPIDRRGPDEARAVAAWVRAGGRVVIADPGSTVASALGFRSTGGGPPLDRIASPDCAAPAVVGVRRIVRPGGPGWRPALGAAACFVDGDEAWLVEARVGRGSATLIGGVAPFTNRLLGIADDGALAWNVLGRGGGVLTIGTPGTAEDAGVWSLIPPPARGILIALALGAVVFALARGRRFGRAPREEIPSPIPATELVIATAELYRRARAADHAAAVLQDGFRRRVARGLGVRPGDAAITELVPDAERDEADRALAARSALDERTLVELAATLERIERRMEG